MGNRVAGQANGSAAQVAVGELAMWPWHARYRRSAEGGSRFDTWRAVKNWRHCPGAQKPGVVCSEAGRARRHFAGNGGR